MPRKQNVSKSVIQVSERDRRIYELVAVEGRSQRDVAAEFKVSQSRISRIVNRTFRWLSETARYGLEEVPRPQRLYGVMRTYQKKLAYYEREANNAWLESTRRQGTTQVWDILPTDDGRGFVRQKGRLTVKDPKPEIKYLRAAQDFAARGAEFEGFAKSGAVARNNNDRLHEVPEVLSDQEVDDLIRCGKRLEAEREAKRAAEERGIESMGDGRGAGVMPTPGPLPMPKPTVIWTSSDHSPETHSAPEVTEPNDFDALSSYEPPRPEIPCEVSERRDRNADGYAEGVGKIFGSTSSRQRRIFSPEYAPDPGPRAFDPGYRNYREEDRANGYPPVGPIGSPLPGPREPEPGRVYPPPPPGYIRSGVRCIPLPTMKRSDPTDIRTRKPAHGPAPPRSYEFDKQTNTWVAHG